MKISKSVLQAVLVGITVSAAASCSVVETLTDKDKHECIESCDEQCTATGEQPTYENCPACGMG